MGIKWCDEMFQECMESYVIHHWNGREAGEWGLMQRVCQSRQDAMDYVIKEGGEGKAQLVEQSGNVTVLQTSQVDIWAIVHVNVYGTIMQDRKDEEKV